MLGFPILRKATFQVLSNSPVPCAGLPGWEVSDLDCNVQPELDRPPVQFQHSELFARRLSYVEAKQFKHFF